MSKSAGSYNKCLWEVQKKLLGDTEGKAVKCFVCGKGYTHQRSLWRHVKYECNQAPMFRCPLCPYATKQKVHLKSHTIRVHWKESLAELPDGLC
ncbi:hypothetical protein J6590_014699 [Homalodisca vitripennis]|nr:hypothetical protein J6590_014699 [Homalodisca vitripennis]